MAMCGWCRTRGLKTENGEDGKGLQTHSVSNSRKKCDGQSTAPGYQRREKGK